MDDDLLLSQLTQEGTEDVPRLKQVWLNEHLAPELLPYQTTLVHDIQAQIQTTTETIKKLEEQKKVETMLRLSILKLDLARYKAVKVALTHRVQYCLSRYLLIRLHKIQRYHTYLLANEQRQQLLSEQELDYLKVAFSSYFYLFNTVSKQMTYYCSNTTNKPTIISSLPSYAICPKNFKEWMTPL
jgi:hypothetical protein